MPHTNTWATALKPHTLTIDSASSCQACCSRPTDTALWKRRSKAAINGQFSTCRRCIEYLLPSCFFETQPRLATSKRGQDFRFYRIFVPTPHMGGVFIVVLQHKGHKPLSIYKKIKSQDIFTVENNKQCHESRIVEESFYVSSRDK